MLASALETTGVTQIQSSRTLVQAFAILHALVCPANDDFQRSQEGYSYVHYSCPRTGNSVCASGYEQVDQPNTHCTPRPDPLTCGKSKGHPWGAPVTRTAFSRSRCTTTSLLSTNVLLSFANFRRSSLRCETSRIPCFVWYNILHESHANPVCGAVGGNIWILLSYLQPRTLPRRPISAFLIVTVP